MPTDAKISCMQAVGEFIFSHSQAITGFIMVIVVIIMISVVIIVIISLPRLKEFSGCVSHA